MLRHPARAALAGAVAIAFSGILYKALRGLARRPARSSAAPTRFPRSGCSSALEERRLGPRTATAPEVTGWLAGAFFAADLLLWHHSIEAVGAGLATVLGEHAGRAGRPAGLGAAAGAAVAELAWLAIPVAHRRDRVDLGRARGRRLRRRPGARDVCTACSRPSRTRASCSRSARSGRPAPRRRAALRRHARDRRARAPVRARRGRPRPAPGTRGAVLVDRARAQRAGLRVAVDHGVATPPARRCDLRAPYPAARGLGCARGDHPGREPVAAPAVGRGRRSSPAC